MAGAIAGGAEEPSSLLFIHHLDLKLSFTFFTPFQPWRTLPKYDLVPYDMVLASENDCPHDKWLLEPAQGGLTYIDRPETMVMPKSRATS